uniref:Uncharacterized protein n=1 Tax=Anopheles atroparvus TaxID=41427 RepID=A0A182JIN7_ANOAO
MMFSARRLGFVLAIGCLALERSSAKVILSDDPDDLIDLSHLGPELYGEPDEAVGKLVANFNPDTDAGNVEELGSYIEGDILIDRPDGRNGVANNANRWPNGVVPFVIAGNFENAFSVNGKPTIEAKRPGGNRMGQRSGFSSGDLGKLNAMYGCKGTGAAPTSSSGNAAPTRPQQRPTRPARPAGNNRPGNGAQVASAIVNFIGGLFGEEDANTSSNGIEGARR